MSRITPQNFRNDLPVADLVEIALVDHGDEEEPTDATKALVTLHDLGTRDVLDAAIDLCKSADPARRKLGAQILGEIRGPHARSGERVFPEECCDALLELVTKDEDVEVKIAALFAIGHLGNRRADPVLVELRNHPDPHFRHGLAFALCGSTSSAAVTALLELMNDSEVMARDWATMGIGMEPSIDGPEIREALLRRATDEDEITRAEAIHGLVRRKDLRVIPLLIHELQSNPDRVHLFEDAAKEWLGLNEDQSTEAFDVIAQLRKDGENYPS